MSSILIALSGCIALGISLYYNKNTSDKKEKTYIVLSTVFATISLVSLMFLVSGRLAYAIFLGSLLAFLLLLALKGVFKPSSGASGKIQILISYSFAYSVIVIIPFIFMVVNFSSIHPILLVLISLAISALLVWVYHHIKDEMFSNIWARISTVIALFLMISLIYPRTNRITYQDFRDLDNVFAREIVFENLFDLDVISSDYPDYQTLWLRNVKVFEDQLYFFAYGMNQHYNSIVRIDLNTKENALLYSSFGENLYDYTIYEETLLVASSDGFWTVNHGEASSLSGVSYFEDRLTYGVFYDNGETLSYVNGDVIYLFESLDEVTYSSNTYHVDELTYLNVNGLYQYDDVFSDNSNYIYDEFGNQIVVEDYYREMKVYQYDLSSNENSLRISQIYSSVYYDGKKGLFGIENSLAEVDGRLQLLPIYYLRGYIRSGEDLYFYVDLSVNNLYPDSRSNVSEAGVYQATLENVTFNAGAFAAYSNYILLVLIVILQKRAEFTL